MCLAAALALSACSGDELPALSDEDAAACSALMGDLPESLFGSEQSAVDGRVASYGDVTVTCGVARPDDYEETSECSEVEGVGWFVPPAILSDGDEDLVAYALSRTPVVRIDVPAEDRLESTDTSLAELAAPLSSHLAEGLPCL